MGTRRRAGFFREAGPSRMCMAGSLHLAAPMSLPSTPRIRWGLCCQFLDAPIRFRQATHRYVSTLGVDERRAYLSSIARANALALAHAVERCHELGIGAFRVNSQIVPLATHPVSGYTLDRLDQGEIIARSFAAV